MKFMAAAEADDELRSRIQGLADASGADLSDGLEQVARDSGFSVTRDDFRRLAQLDLGDELGEEQLQNVVGGASGDRVESLSRDYQQTYSILSKIMKSNHDTYMSVVRNMKA